MSSREIAELTGKRHDHILRDIETMAGFLGTSPQIWGHLPDAYGRPQRVANLPRRECLILVSGYSIEMRARIIDRWQTLEAVATPQVPQTYAAALRLAAEQAERIEQQAAALALAAPKVAVVDRYMSANGGQTFRQVARILGAKEPAFRAWLAASRIMYQLAGQWTPYAEHIDAGRFEVKAGSAQNGHAFSSALFTPKGVAWVAERWAKQAGA